MLFKIGPYQNIPKKSVSPRILDDFGAAEGGLLRIRREHGQGRRQRRAGQVPAVEPAWEMWKNMEKLQSQTGNPF